MNTYYKLSLLYIIIGVVFLIVGFFSTHDFAELEKFYNNPKSVALNDTVEEDNASQS